MSRSSNKRLWFGLASLACLMGFALLLIAYITTPRTSDVLPAATATQVLPTIVVAASTQPATDTPRPIFTFGALGEVVGIHINDSPYSFTETRQDFVLHRVGNQFTGSADFYTNGNPYPTTPFAAMRAITIPQNIAQTFLQLLSQTATSGPQPLDHPTPAIVDCYPRIYIDIETLQGSARISTQSCDTDNIPWQVQYDRQLFLTASNLPAKALDIIRPYLRYDVIESFYKHETPAP